MRTLSVAAVLLLTLGGCGSSMVGSPSSPSGSSDAVAPTVSITSPTATGNFSTASAAVSLAGSAADNVAVASVGWRNAANGASGSASGTGSWSIPGIALVSGVNTITVTARDTAGNSGGASLIVIYNPGGAVALSGNIDSSLVDRNASNAVYLYSGTVVPDDIGSATPPIATAPVTQDNGACTFSYRFGGLAPGTYTVAFTNQAASDSPVSNDAITFSGTATVTVPSSGTAAHDFAPSRLLRVGPTRTGVNAFTLPSAALAAAQTGDVIEIDAGEYVDDNAVWSKSNLTLRGVGGRAHMRNTSALIPNGKAIWVVASNAVVENIEFSGATVTDLNGAGIRADATNLTVCNGYFHDNQNGILGGGGIVLVEYSEFDHNGNCTDPTAGCAHNMYISGNTQRFTLQYSYSHRAHEGHLVKSRALENHILYNRIMDEDGDPSYEIDLPNAGQSFIIGNLIQQGPSTGNSTIIAYGEEGVPAGAAKELYVVNNTIVNDLGSGRYIDSLPAGTTARLVNNIFSGEGGVSAGVPTGAGVTSANNLFSNAPGLADSAGFDYHLTSTSPARNAGADPGSVGAVSLVPTSHYVNPISREDRPVDGAIDIGAYEFQ